MTWLVSWPFGWQDVAAWVVVVAAVGFLADRFFFASRRKKRGASKKPDVPVSALVRKRREPPKE